jgi:DNA polymerase bacteriophage-type
MAHVDYCDELHFDFETKSETDLTKAGLMRYALDPSTEAMLCSYKFRSWGKNATPKLWDYNDTRTFPAELSDAIEDPRVMKVAFNAQFERIICKHVLGLETDYASWRCGMVLAYMLSFIGGLGDVAKQIGAPIDKQKMTEGARLIRLFCMPQRITRNQPYLWRDSLTDEEDWELFREYCIQDTVAEIDQWNKFIKYPVGEKEWEVYAFDQKVNDRGYPLDLKFCHNAIAMVQKRKAEVIAEMRGITKLANPNSPAQLLPWLRERGYPFKDLQKNTVKKALSNFKDDMTDDAIAAAKLRRWSASTAATKYQTYVNREVNGRYMMGLQMAGAQRTRRWGGRGAQPHNQARTPKDYEEHEWAEGSEKEVHGVTKLEVATNIVRDGDYEALKLFAKEPMEVLAGIVRSAIAAPKGKQLRVTDLTSVESIGVAYVSKCERMLNVFRNGKDIYKDFGTVMYGVAYEQISKQMRTDSKPAILGAGFGLGGGKLDEEGERTGLWGYAESMGIDMTLEASHQSVNAFRDDYAPEVPTTWGELDAGVRGVMEDGKPRKAGMFRIEYMQPFLLLWLPSGRPIFYYKPQIEKIPMVSKAGNPYTRYQFSYMGKAKNSNKWIRVNSWGGKLIENGVQAFCRDVLVEKLLALDALDFYLVMHVHDEGISEEDEEDDVHTLDVMNHEFRKPPSYALDMPMGSAGYVNRFYKKD